MNEYEEKTATLTVPLNTGVEGFLKAIRKILTLSRVIDLTLDYHGRVTYRRAVRRSSPDPDIEIDFESVTPMGIVRNCPNLEEVDVSATIENAAVCIARLYEKASLKQLFPVAFVVGADTTFFEWMRHSTGVAFLPDQIYGIPAHRDRTVGDDVLVMCVAYSRDGGLIDVQEAYKIVMPSRELPLRLDSVDVMALEALDAPVAPKALS